MDESVKQLGKIDPWAAQTLPKTVPVQEELQGLVRDMGGWSYQQTTTPKTPSSGSSDSW